MGDYQIHTQLGTGFMMYVFPDATLQIYAGLGPALHLVAELFKPEHYA